MTAHEKREAKKGTLVTDGHGTAVWGRRGKL